MAESKGTSHDGQRVRALEKARENQKIELEERKAKIRQDNAVDSTAGGLTHKFSTRSSAVEEQLKQDTVGLVTKDEFRKKREALEKAEAYRQREEDLRKANEKVVVAKKKVVSKSTLSFGEELGDDETAEAEEEERVAKKAKLGKNPAVDTSFLPDRERDAVLQTERRRLQAEWEEKQKIIKADPIEVTYSYWDGAGHRRSANVTKGTTIEKFLEVVRLEFKELRGLSVENLIFIKEDLIIPHQFSFYDLIINQARGKSGPLFHFDVHEDVRLVNDASVEKDESHAGKVVERRWYEKNRHIFPASRWEVYDPAVQRGAYSIHDHLEKH